MNFEDYSEVRRAAIEEQCARRIALPDFVSDAQGSFSDAEYAAITAAIIGACAAERGDAIPQEKLAAIGALLVTSVKRVIARGAEVDADIEIEAMRREAESRYACERMEA